MSQPPRGPDCYRHPGVETWIGCQRCRRPICPACMTQAAVGVQCPECVAEGVRSTRSDQLAYGGRRVANPALLSYLLIGINLAVWAAILLTGGEVSPLYHWLALQPQGSCVSVTDPGAYYPDFGAQQCRAVGGTWRWVPGVSNGAIWQLLTSAFSHVAVLHIGSNLLVLYYIGPPLERAFGRARYLAVYLLSGLGGSVAVYWLSPTQSVTIGASGAIFGLLGALFVVTMKVRGDLRTIGLMLALNLVATWTIPDVSWEGHIGGLLTGAALSALIVYAPRERRAQWQWAGMAALFVVMAILVAIRTVMLR